MAILVRKYTFFCLPLLVLSCAGCVKRASAAPAKSAAAATTDAVHAGQITEIPRTNNTDNSLADPTYTGSFDSDHLAYTDSAPSDGLLVIRQLTNSPGDRASADFIRSILRGSIEFRPAYPASPLHLTLTLKQTDGTEKNVELDGPAADDKGMSQLTVLNPFDLDDTTISARIKCIDETPQCKVAQVHIFKQVQNNGTPVTAEADAIFRHTPVKLDLTFNPQVEKFSDPNFQYLAILLKNGILNGGRVNDYQRGRSYTPIYPNRLNQIALETFATANGRSQFVLKLNFLVKNNASESALPIEKILWLKGDLVKSARSDSALSHPVAILNGKVEIQGEQVAMADDLARGIGSATLETNDGHGHLSLRLQSTGTDASGRHDQIVLGLTRE